MMNMEHNWENNYDKLQRITNDVYKYCNVEQWVGLLLSDQDALRLLAWFDDTEEADDGEEEYTFTIEDVNDAFWNYASVLLRDKQTNALIWAVTLAPIDWWSKKNTIHEASWLWIDQAVQNKWYWIFLMHTISSLHTDTLIISCTNNPKVSHINTHYLQMKELTENQLSKELKELLELWWPLDGKNYQYFVNDQLYAVLFKNKG
jgi:hypothetical protein